MYDTATAKKVAADWFSDTHDFSYWIEELFIKENGEFFLFGEGGPRSHYRKMCGLDEWSDGWNILPLSAEEARKWAEDHATVDEYIEIFGKPEE